MLRMYENEYVGICGDMEKNAIVQYSKTEVELFI
jgi:hypothetical protein